MSESELVNTAREIVASTFVSMALQVPGTQFEEREQFWMVSGTSSLSICNFAIKFDLSEEPEQVVEGMVRRSKSMPAFSVFSATGDKPENSERLWVENGFQVRQILTTFVSESALDGERTELAVCETKEDRLRIADFMVEQFFLRVSDPQKQAIALALASSPHGLHFSEDGFGVASAAMRVETAKGAALYNLCVRSDRRSQGEGSKIVREFSTWCADPVSYTHLRAHET